MKHKIVNYITKNIDRIENILFLSSLGLIGIYLIIVLTTLILLKP